MIPRFAFTLTAAAALILTACGDDPRDLTYGELRQLSTEQQQELAENLSGAEFQALMRAGLSRALDDTAAVNQMTIQELIDEGMAMNEGAEPGQE